MPAERTPHEKRILKRYEDGEAINAIARRYGISRRTVHAVLDRNKRERASHTHVARTERVLRAARRLSKAVLRYANKQPKTPERDDLIEALGDFDSTVKEVE